MNDTAEPRQTPPTWLRAIEEGRADVAAGRTFDFDETFAEFEREDAASAARASTAQGRAKA